MKSKVIVPLAERQRREITEFIFLDNPAAAERYALQAMSAFFDLPENIVPVRASEHLPDDIRQLPVPGFPGYTLRLLYRREYIALVAAFRPGLTAAMRDRSTRSGVDEFKDRYGEG